MGGEETLSGSGSGPLRPAPPPHLAAHQVWLSGGECRYPVRSRRLRSDRSHGPVRPVGQARTRQTRCQQPGSRASFDFCPTMNRRQSGRDDASSANRGQVLTYTEADRLQDVMRIDLVMVCQRKVPTLCTAATPATLCNRTTGRNQQFNRRRQRNAAEPCKLRLL